MVSYQGYLVFWYRLASEKVPKSPLQKKISDCSFKQCLHKFCPFKLCRERTLAEMYSKPSCQFWSREALFYSSDETYCISNEQAWLLVTRTTQNSTLCGMPNEKEPEGAAIAKSNGKACGGGGWKTNRKTPKCIAVAEKLAFTPEHVNHYVFFYLHRTFPFHFPGTTRISTS